MKKILIVDTRLLAYKSFHLKEDFLKTFYYIGQYAEDYLPYDKVVLAYDGRKGSAKRKLMYPAYKQHRRDREKKQTEVEQLRLKEFNNNYNKMSEFTSKFVTSINIETIEADDVASIIVNKLKDKYEIYLLSSDSDWGSNIVNDNIKQIHLNRGLITRSNVMEKYGKLPEDNDFIGALVGRAKDNVIGVYRLGENRIKKMLYEMNMSKDEILKQVQNWVDNKKYGMRLPDCEFNNVKELFEFNYELLKGFTFDDLNDDEAKLFTTQFNKEKEIYTIDELNDWCVSVYGKGFYTDIAVLKLFDFIN
jgi:5'-3' exonuclease